ncbi:hypothetical protein ACFE04_029038 [Oxalis oulophora]
MQQGEDVSKNAGSQQRLKWSRDEGERLTDKKKKLRKAIRLCRRAAMKGERESTNEGEPKKNEEVDINIQKKANTIYEGAHHFMIGICFSFALIPSLAPSLYDWNRSTGHKVARELWETMVIMVGMLLTFLIILLKDQEIMISTAEGVVDHNSLILNQDKCQNNSVLASITHF